MAHRITQDSVEVVSREIVKARITQVVIEAITREVAKLRLTQDAVEAITREVPKVRFTQDSVEVVTKEKNTFRLTQVAIEIISRVVPPWLVDTVCAITWPGIVPPFALTIDCVCDISWRRPSFRIDEHDEITWFTSDAFWPIRSLCELLWQGVNNLFVVGWTIAQVDTEIWFPPVKIVLEKCITGTGVSGFSGLAPAAMWTSNDI